MLRPAALLMVLIGASNAVLAEAPKYPPLTAVPFTQVKFQDSFWAPRLETNRLKSLPYLLQVCRETGRIDNFAKAAGLMKGAHEGYFFNDSDVYKLIEGAAYSLAVHPDPKLETQIDEIIALIAAAQQPDGYLNTFFTLTAPDKRWTNVHAKHELYCAGHLIEAAVAYFNATGKRTLLDVAEKFVDHIAGKFGPDKLREPSGHEEIELALVKLYRFAGKPEYLKLADLFIRMRGDNSRPQRWGPDLQDHLPVRRQDEIFGHAVRATYLCAGATDVAVCTGDRSLLDAMNRLWKNMVRRKMYVTGGVGSRHEQEAFGTDFELPNDTAYCETCAAIGVVLWAQRMNLLYADAQYADVMERALYNGVLSGVALDGEHFFYVNPLASDGKHHRQEYFKCECCPMNVVRFLPALTGYVYAVKQGGGTDELFVNLYVGGDGHATLDKSKVLLTQKTRYPWDGKIRLTVEPEKSAIHPVSADSELVQGSDTDSQRQAGRAERRKGLHPAGTRVAVGRRGRAGTAHAHRTDRGQPSRPGGSRPRGASPRSDRLLFRGRRQRRLGSKTSLCPSIRSSRSPFAPTCSAG